jgi:hypothetical protein
VVVVETVMPEPTLEPVIEVEVKDNALFGGRYHDNQWKDVY